MNNYLVKKRLKTLFLASRPQFLVASISPVLVGSSLAYAVAGTFNFVLFILALLAIMALHAGANITNDYFDHVSGNDWVNKNPTPFSGGSRCIQQGILSPQATLLTGLFFLALGSAIGLMIVFLTKSVLIFTIGLIGLLGGFFYTAPPIKLGYRCVGELVIALLFGLLPVYASYYLQTGTVDFVPFLPACIIAILIFLVILANEFPDVDADTRVNKRTLVVKFGIPTAVWIYRIVLVASFVFAITMLFFRSLLIGGLLYFVALPVAVAAIEFANKEDLAKPGQYRASQVTVLLHALGTVELTIGFVITGVRFFVVS